MLNTERDLLDRAHKVNWTIWLAIIVFLLSLVGVALSVAPDAEEGEGEIFKFVLFFPSLVIPLALIQIRRAMFRIDPKKPLAESPDQAFAAGINNYRRVSVVSMALAEVIGLNGFVIYFVAGDFTLLIVSMILALLVFLYIRPSRSDLQDYARAQRDHPRFQNTHL